MRILITIDTNKVSDDPLISGMPVLRVSTFNNEIMTIKFGNLQSLLDWLDFGFHQLSGYLKGILREDT